MMANSITIRAIFRESFTGSAKSPAALEQAFSCRLFITGPPNRVKRHAGCRVAGAPERELLDVDLVETCHAG
jgi:hypothetical protein